MITKKILKNEISRLENRISSLQTLLESTIKPTKWRVIDSNGKERIVKADKFYIDNGNVIFYDISSSVLEYGKSYFAKPISVEML